MRRSRKEQGWTLQNTKYYQLIREVNKVKRHEFAQRVIDTEDASENVIFSDKCSIFLQKFRRTCYRKIDEPSKRKPRPKHPLRLHILEGALIPFIRETLPNHSFMQENDPKHTPKAFFEENNINWWRTPPPPPRKSRSKFNLWHEVKYFFESKVKPQTTQELLEGIKKFWGRRVTIEKCNNYINDVLFEAIPDVIAAGGRATKHSAFCSLLRTNFSQTAPSGATTASKSQ